MIAGSALAYIFNELINEVYLMTDIPSIFICQSHDLSRSLKVEKLMYICKSVLQIWLVGWLVGFGFNGPLRQCFSLYRAVSQREGERGERIDESKNVQTTPTRT